MPAGPPEKNTEEMRNVLLKVAGLVAGMLMAIVGVSMIESGENAVYAGLMLGAGVVVTALSGWYIFDTVRDYEKVTEAFCNMVETTKVDPTTLSMSRVELWQHVLQELNVDTRPDEDHKGRYHFDYQGGHFYVDIDDYAFAEVYYAFIEEVELSDVEEVSLMRRAINETNYNACPTVVYSTDKDGDKMYVHMLQSVLLVPQIPQASEYLKSRLNVFFQLQRHFAGIVDRLRQEA